MQRAFPPAPADRGMALSDGREELRQAASEPMQETKRGSFLEVLLRAWFYGTIPLATALENGCKL